MSLKTCDGCGESISASNLALHQVRCRGRKTDGNYNISTEASVPPLIGSEQMSLPTAVPIECQEVWSCSVCTLINQPAVANCEMCGANNTASTMASEMPSVPNENESAAENDVSACSVCTYHNALNASSCEMCGTSLNNNNNAFIAPTANEENDGVRPPDAQRRERLVNDEPFSGADIGGGSSDLFDLMFQGLSNATDSSDAAEMQDAIEAQQERRVSQSNRVATSSVLGAFAGAMNAVMNDEDPLRGALTGGSLGYMGSSIFNEFENISSAPPRRSSNGSGSSSNSSRTARNRGGMHISLNGRRVFGSSGHINNFPAMLAQVLSHRGQMDVDNMGYEELLEMFGTGRNTRRAPDQTINALPTHQHVACKEENEEKECNICLDTFKNGECIKTLPCGHAYHDGCISKWLENVANCPICKKDI